MFEIYGGIVTFQNCILNIIMKVDTRRKAVLNLYDGIFTLNVTKIKYIMR